MTTMRLNLTGEKIKNKNKTFKNGEQNRENKGLQRALRYFCQNCAHTN